MQFIDAAENPVHTISEGRLQVSESDELRCKEDFHQMVMVGRDTKYTVSISKDVSLSINGSVEN